jgi:hypothetical protein
VIGIVAGIVLGAALVWAGFAKLLAGPDWTRQAADLGVARELALPVPYVEIVLGALVAAHVVAPWPAVAALVLLIAYTVLLAVRLADGSRPPCACFGRRSTRPLGVWHLARNAALIGLAVLAVVGS